MQGGGGGGAVGGIGGSSGGTTVDGASRDSSGISEAGGSSSAAGKGKKGAAASSSGAAPADTPFKFQLVPTGADGEETGMLRKVVDGKKTHYFAVKSRDERIDWMRELMLAKASREKEKKGYEVEIHRGPSWEWI